MRIGRGDSDARAPISGSDEVGVLAREFNAMADAVADREARLRRQTTALEASNRELEAFSYSVSHDLRAPLRTIDGFSRAIEKDYGDRIDDEGRRLLERVRHASRHMAELIDDLLDLAHVTMSEMQREPIDLTALAREMTAELRAGDGGRDIELTVQGGMRAVGDARLVSTLLRSLLDNAWKFTRDRSPARIEVGVDEVDGVSAFYVRDNGAGFDMRYVDKLFRPFQRLHRQEEFGGTGIGLATVKRIVDRHDGKAWAEGAVGEGATMFFTLEGGDNA
jgi:light-regulated signal transduction histidine kinase (bacteriophytochrome)